MPLLRLHIWMAILAAGSAFAPGSNGQGTIIYVNQPRTFSGILGVPWTHDFDLDGDGVSDYRFSNDGAISYVSPLGSNRQIAYLATPPDMGSSLTPLFAGEIIGSSLDPVLGEWLDLSSPNMGWQSMISGCLNIGCFGPFAYRTAFMGVDFAGGDGERHFGWLRIDDTTPGGHVFLVDWAWAVIPGESLVAGAVPEPSTWALLVGGGVLVVWFTRKRNERKG
ncbi:MAG: PEP-CTERM sorting domain-containing protein [Verrucomicrobiota bacterium]|nr:PEP-CTERM sorting domain-containing protein [Verrucomicrobiota bacterium]